MSEPVTLQDIADQIEAGFRKVADAWNEAVKAIAESLDAECTEGAIGMLDTDPHGGCPCRKTGVHRVHRCEHGTEWWQNPPTVDASATTTPGEGHRTGTGGPDAPGASEGLDAAIEAALHAALYEAYIEITYVPDWETYEGNCRVCDNYCADGDKADITADASEHIAVVHVRSAKDAEPLLRQAVVEELAANPVRWEYGIFQDRTADGLGHAFLATRHTREDALAAVDRLANEEPNYPAYAAKRSVRHGTWELLDVAREIGAKP